jgi:hypothetical protein
MEGILTADRLTDWLLLVAALVTAMAVFALLTRIVRVLFVPLVLGAIALGVAKFAFGISPAQLWQESWHLGQGLLQKLAQQI